MARAAAGRRYAKALFALAQESGQVAEVRTELESLGRAISTSEELQDVLLQPLHPAAQRRAVLGTVAERIGASKLLRNFLSFLVDQRRLVDWAAIEAEYQRLADEAAGLSQARVRSASPLTAVQRERLQRALEQKSGGKVELVVELDPTLLGGAVAQLGDVVYDGSLKTQLQQLRASLARG
jgi:F-type H+-transporting ATPase subunit delta